VLVLLLLLIVCVPEKFLSSCTGHVRKRPTPFTQDENLIVEVLGGPTESAPSGGFLISLLVAW